MNFLNSDIDHFSGQPALILPDGNQIGYQELSQSAMKASAAIPARSLVACLCKNTAGSVIAYLSILNAGGAGLMLDSAMNLKSLITQMNLYRPNLMWVPADHPLLHTGLKEIFRQNDYVLLDSGKGYTPQMHPELSLLLPTSGSTGSSKFVRLTRKNLEANALSIAEYLKIGPDERPVTVLPMHYSFGLSVINSHLIQGASILLTTHSVMEKEFWAFTESAGATSFSGVPYTYQMLDRLRFFNKDLAGIRTFTQAGGKMSDELIKKVFNWCNERNKTLVVMYGQTEATARISWLPPNRLPEKTSSVGIPIPGGKVKILGPDGVSLSPGETGELIYFGDNVSMGYAENEEDLAKGDEFRGCLHTGDLASIDEDGFIYISGRKKRFLKLFGNRVSLDEVESKLRSITTEVACSGTDEQLTAYVTEERFKAEVLCTLREMVAVHPSALRVEVISSIPKNSSGKILYASLDSEVVV